MIALPEEITRKQLLEFADTLEAFANWNRQLKAAFIVLTMDPETTIANKESDLRKLGGSKLIGLSHGLQLAADLLSQDPSLEDRARDAAKELRQVLKAH